MQARHRPTWLMNQWSESSPMSERRSCSVLLFGVLVSRPFSYNVIFYIVKMRALKRCNAQNVSNVSLQVSIITTPRLWLCRFSFIQAIVIQGLMSVCDSYTDIQPWISHVCVRPDLQELCWRKEHSRMQPKCWIVRCDSSCLEVDELWLSPT